MDPVNPTWLATCTSELNDGAPTSMNGTFATATYTLYADSSCTTEIYKEEWTDFVSGDNCVIPNPGLIEDEWMDTEDWLIWCDEDDVYVDWFRYHDEEGESITDARGNCDGEHEGTGYIGNGKCWRSPEDNGEAWFQITCAGSNFLV